MSTEEAVERETHLRAGGNRIEYLRFNVREVDSGTSGWETQMYFFLCSASIIIYFTMDMNAQIPFYSPEVERGIWE